MSPSSAPRAAGFPAASLAMAIVGTALVLLLFPLTGVARVARHGVVAQEAEGAPQEQTGVMKIAPRRAFAPITLACAPRRARTGDLPRNGVCLRAWG